MHKYLTPESVSEAITLAKDHIGWFRYVAGGTDLFVNKFQGNDTSGCLIDITKIKELSGVIAKDGYLRIGALTKLNELESYDSIKKEFPTLIEAAKSVGTPLIRSSATIGGNILCDNRCYYYNQSEWWRDAIGYCLKCEGETCIITGTGKSCYAEFVSDMAPVLISMDALLEIADENQIRTVKLEDIYTGDGISPRNLRPTEILTSILVPLNQNFRTVFKKLRKRESVDFTSLTTAVTMNKNRGIKVAISGTDPKPVVIESRAYVSTEEILKSALKMSRSIDNEMHSRTYRRNMMGVFLRKSFEELGFSLD